MNSGDEDMELDQEILSIVKQAMMGALSDEDATDRIMYFVERYHHCASCDMHACGDLEKAHAKMAGDLDGVLDAEAGLREILDGRDG